MTDSGERDDVSKESFTRMTAERDKLKEENEALTAQMAPLARVDQVYQHLSSLEGDAAVDGDKYLMAKRAVNDVTVRGAEGDALGDVVDTWVSDQKSLFTPPIPQGEVTEGETPEPEPSESPPVPAPTAPSPGGEGPAPTAQALGYMEWRRNNPNATLEDSKAAQDAGEWVKSPG